MGCFYKCFKESGLMWIMLTNLFVSLLALHMLESLLYIVPSRMMTYTQVLCVTTNHCGLAWSLSKRIKKHQTRIVYFSWQGRHHFLIHLIISLNSPSKGRNKLSVAKWEKVHSQKFHIFGGVTLKSTNRPVCLYIKKYLLVDWPPSAVC